MTETRPVTTPFNSRSAAAIVERFDLGGRRREQGPR
jgi:hypothetical protein